MFVFISKQSCSWTLLIEAARLHDACSIYDQLRSNALAGHMHSLAPAVSRHLTTLTDWIIGASSGIESCGSIAQKGLRGGKHC
jgi:hypothetical protein